MSRAAWLLLCCCCVWAVVVSAVLVAVEMGHPHWSPAHASAVFAGGLIVMFLPPAIMIWRDLP